MWCDVMNGVRALALRSHKTMKHFPDDFVFVSYRIRQFMFVCLLNAMIYVYGAHSWFSLHNVSLLKLNICCFVVFFYLLLSEFNSFHCRSSFIVLFIVYFSLTLFSVHILTSFLSTFICCAHSMRSFTLTIMPHQKTFHVYQKSCKFSKNTHY